MDGMISALKTVVERQSALAEEKNNPRIRIKRLESELRYMQGKDVAKNPIIFNYKPEDTPTTEDNIKEKIVHFFSEAAIDVDFDQFVSAQRLGKPNLDTPDKVASVLITLAKASLGKNNFQAVQDLYRRFNLRVPNDLSPPQMKEIQQIRDTKKQLLKYNVACTVKGFDIIINGKPHNWKAALEALRNSQARSIINATALIEDNAASNSDISIRSTFSKRKANAISSISN